MLPELAVTVPTLTPNGNVAVIVAIAAPGAIATAKATPALAAAPRIHEESFDCI